MNQDSPKRLNALRAAWIGLLAVCSGGIPSAAAEESKALAHFTEATSDVIPLEQRFRRKWDNAVIADLDQNGHMDVLITEHANRARIFWNEGGTFSKPQDVITGDTHGVSAGDYDQDGRMDLIIAPGGGGGDKPQTAMAFQVNHDRSIEGGDQFTHFQPIRGRAAKLLDVDNNGSLDLILTAFPLPNQLRGGNLLYRNTDDKEFEFVDYLPRAQWMGFRLAVIDYNNDSIFDTIHHGGANIVLARGDEGMAFKDVSKEVLGDLANTTFVSSISEIDFDNDGDFDLFLTRSDHPFDEKTYFDSDQGRFAFFARRQEFLYEDLKIEGDFVLENLQMAYPHFDVFVGKDKRLLEFELERHGHQDFTLKAKDAEGWPDDLSDKGLYIGHVGDGLWRIGGDTTSPTAGVVHNVLSTPEVTGNEPMPALLLENRGGVFVDVTKKLGVSTPEQTTSAAVGDFDNNGYADLLVIRHGSPASQTGHILYLNQDGKSFVRAKGHGIYSSELGSVGGGADTFDYDQDGDLDVLFSTERGRWRLFTNHLDTADNHWVTVKVGSAPSGEATANGAVLTLRAGGQIYQRVVGASSAAFSMSANSHLHVGLGDCEVVDEATVRWTNGETETLKIDATNQRVTAGQ